MTWTGGWWFWFTHIPSAQLHVIFPNSPTQWKTIHKSLMCWTDPKQMCWRRQGMRKWSEWEREMGRGNEKDCEKSDNLLINPNIQLNKKEVTTLHVKLVVKATKMQSSSWIRPNTDSAPFTHKSWLFGCLFDGVQNHSHFSSSRWWTREKTFFGGRSSPREETHEEGVMMWEQSHDQTGANKMKRIQVHYKV